MSLQLITLERLEQIEKERTETQSSHNFQRWVRELNVSKLYVDRDGITRANAMMEEWNLNKIN